MRRAQNRLSEGICWSITSCSCWRLTGWSKVFRYCGWNQVITANGVFCSGWALRAAVGAQLIDLTAEGDQLPVQLIKGAETEIAVLQQVGDGGAPS
jgi:hypothetical protein